LRLDVLAARSKKLVMLWLRVALSAALLFVLPQAAHAQDLAGSRSLLSDVARIVAAQENESWFSDREALSSIEEPLLESTCRATAEARAWALSGLMRRHEQLGEPKALFLLDGRVTSRVSEALTAQRQLVALQHALARVADECPFWITPEPGFTGLQSDKQRLTFSVESGGNVQLRYTEKRWTFGGGGLGRFLFGYGLDGRYSFFGGVEFGGGAMLRPGTNASQFVINYFPALPFVFRTRELTWHYDLELAPVAIFQADNTDLSYGARIGGAFAFTGLRRRNVLPWAGLAVAYEYYWEGGGREPTHFIRGGLRIGLPWDP
jgi:hypothetical protein